MSPKSEQVLALSARLVNASIQPGAVAETICDELGAAFGAGVSIEVVEGEERQIVAVGHQDPAVAEQVRWIAGNTRTPKDQGLPGQVIGSGEPLVLADIDQEELRSTLEEGIRERIDIEVHSLAILPMHHGDEVLGILALFSLEPGSSFDEDELRQLAAVADIAAVAIANERVVQDLRVELERRTKAEAARKRLEDKLLQSQKLESLGVLAGGIAHDFNNLLVGVLGNASLALMDLPQNSPVRPTLQSIQRAARTLADLSQQMLAYSGRGAFVIQPVDLSSLVEEVTHLIRASISKKAVLKLELAADLPPVDADVSQLRQVILNLVMNASDAIALRSGFIRVSTSLVHCSDDYLAETLIPSQAEPGYFACLEVSDTGGGMDEETQKRIWDPFFTTKETGRGLGLAAVLGIVRGHGGALRVYSEPGRGTTIKVLLPVTAEIHAPVEEQESQGQLVMLVDDEETCRAVGRQILERAGYRVLVAADGYEAVAYFKSRQDIDLVLLDLTMPKMDGAETFSALRRIDEAIRIVLTSGYGERDVTTAFAGKRLNGFVQKPWAMADMLAIIKQAFDD